MQTISCLQYPVTFTGEKARVFFAYLLGFQSLIRHGLMFISDSEGHTEKLRRGERGGLGY